MDINIIKVELTTDPLTRGYSTMTDEEASTDLNTVYRTRNRTSMTGREVAAEIVNAEYDALSDAKKNQILSLSSASDIDPYGFAANVIKDVFGAGSLTVTALALARVENISRATELGLGVVYPGHVEEARR